MLEALQAASDSDMQAIQQAYDVLRKIGNATAVGEEWDYYIDRAHHDLGLLLAFSGHMNTEISHRPPTEES